MLKIIKKLAIFSVVAGVVAAGVYLSRNSAQSIMTIRELLTENKELKESLANLTAEDQIGYAKVIDQQFAEGRLMTRLLFVETDRADRLKRLVEKEYVIEGDIVHFDALIVKFGDTMVADGTERALYIWRRVYGERTAPADGMAISEPSMEPRRYEGLLRKLHIDERRAFWSAIWELANDPFKLREYDIHALYGNAVYYRVQPGLIYVFKITAPGQIYIEAVPQL